MVEHNIVVDYEVAWTAGPGRQAFAVAGGTPDRLLDKRTDIFVGWDCDCGSRGTTKTSLGEHTRAALDDGQGYDLRVVRRGE